MEEKKNDAPAVQPESQPQPSAPIPAQKGRMSRKQFWIRFALWVVFAVVVPVAFLAWRYGLFSTREGSETSMTGWGIVAIIIIAVFLLKLLNEAKKGLPEGSMLAQCLDGYKWEIPLVLIIFMLENIKNNVDALEETLIVLAVSEAIAIPINPMRRWAYENKIERNGSFLKKVLSEAISEGLKK